MSFLLSLLPRGWLQRAMFYQWRRTITVGESLRLEHFGGTGNPKHHPFSWADELKERKP